MSSLRHTLAQGDSQARTHGALGSAGLPVLGIWGAADRVIPLEARDLLASANPSARHYVVADAGHGLGFTHPEPVAREIAEFLRPVEIARGKTYGAE
ncbi:MAG: alpha/beta fold hydrolase [Pseudomonadota bacterium]